MNLQETCVATSFMAAGIRTAQKLMPALVLDANTGYLFNCLISTNDVLIRIVSTREKHLSVNKLMGQMGSKLLNVFRYCEDHIEEVTPYVHDFWTTGAAIRNNSFGTSTEPKTHTHALMKPLADFDEKELAQEKDLARGDIHGFTSYLERILTGDSPIEPTPLTRVELKDYLGSQLAEVVDLACLLLMDKQMLETAAINIHENWLAVKQRNSMANRGDSRSNKKFKQLNDSDKSVTINNVYNDFCAVIAFLLDLSK